MVGDRHSMFRYKTIKGYLHKLPPLLKLIMLLPFSVFCLSLPPLWLAAGIISAVFTAFMCKFTLQEQVTDIKPAAFYAVLMYALSIFSNLFEYWGIIPPAALAVAVFIPHSDFLQIALRLLLMVQMSALLFRTTTSMEIRESLYAVERFFRRLISRLPFTGNWISHRLRFANSISLFLSFIPEIFSAWSSISLSWKARGGKRNLAKIKTLTLILITHSLEKAAIKAKALEARENQENTV